MNTEKRVLNVTFQQHSSKLQSLLLSESRCFSEKINYLYFFQQWSIIRATQEVDYVVQCVKAIQKMRQKEGNNLDW